MRLTPEQAFNAVTLNSAYAMGVSDRTGSIARGKAADLILTRPGFNSIGSITYMHQTPFIRKVFLRGGHGDTEAAANHFSGTGW